ncbi:MAG: Ig-like domain-containing protein, partial [Methanosarcinaceae archaeon]
MAMVTGLNESEVGYTWINWTWTNPDDTDFNRTRVYIDGVFKENTSNNYYNATNLTNNTQYEIGTRTVDQAGNINYTWVNDTASTMEMPDTEKPVINSVNLNVTGTETGKPILVTVDVTDNIEVTAVQASGTALNYETGTIWEGIITALEGTHQVNVSATDEAGNIGWNNSTTYTAVPVNQPPELATIEDQLVAENDSLAFTLTAKDPDNDELTYATNATFGTLMGNEFTWTPNYEESGTYYVEFNVTDGVLNDSETVTITVENVNRPPELELIEDQLVAENDSLA